ncbi:Methyltransferase tpcH [Cladobotryum mycophilum]|uniref:Methyltransferase tpcH n=1 Tax=Cladobotryum mycophilum TaxID=491253 RepID=A0ABR0SHV2_9HYPO
MTSTPNLKAMSDSLSQFFQDVGKQTPIQKKNHLISSRGVPRTLALPLLEQIGIRESSTGPLCLLDMACGSGVFTQEVQAVLPRDVLQGSSFTCADNSARLVDVVKTRIEAEGWVNAEAKVLDAMNTGLPNDVFTHVAIPLGLHIIPDPDLAVKECIRSMKPGAIFGATTFPNSNADRFWFPDMRSAFESFPFDAPFQKAPMQMHSSGHWYDPVWVEGHLEELGLEDVQVNVVEGNYHVESATEFAMGFGMMLPWLTSVFWDEEARKAHPAEELRELLKTHLEEKHGGKGWDIDWHVIVMTGVVKK